jgi:GNAT superfamily N-acetyltransferase
MTIAAATGGGQACGFITTTVMPASLMLGTAWLIRDLYVIPQRRRGGIAAALLQHVIDEARSVGAYRVSLRTEAENTPALSFMRQRAFSGSAAWKRSTSPSRLAATSMRKTRASTPSSPAASAGPGRAHANR